MMPIRIISGFSPDPEDSIEARWGLKKCEMIDARTRTAKASIAFIEKTYRKRDPRYADFSIMHQRETLRRLGRGMDPFSNARKRF